MKSPYNSVANVLRVLHQFHIKSVEGSILLNARYTETLQYLPPDGNSNYKLQIASHHQPDAHPCISSDGNSSPEPQMSQYHHPDVSSCISPDDNPSLEPRMSSQHQPDVSSCTSSDGNSIPEPQMSQYHQPNVNPCTSSDGNFIVPNHGCHHITTATSTSTPVYHHVST